VSKIYQCVENTYIVIQEGHFLSVIKLFLVCRHLAKRVHHIMRDLPVWPQKL